MLRYYLLLINLSNRVGLFICWGIALMMHNQLQIIIHRSILSCSRKAWILLSFWTVTYKHLKNYKKFTIWLGYCIQDFYIVSILCHIKRIAYGRQRAIMIWLFSSIYMLVQINICEIGVNRLLISCVINIWGF